MKKQRMMGTELEHFQQTSAPKHLESKYKMAAEKKANWKKKHDDFIQSIRSARNYTTGGSCELNIVHVHCI